jgi:Na+-translocating ferredoxin:NAD+ oxidoreductase RNF subunit RnfB
MVLNERPGVFDGNTAIRAMSREEAQATLRRAAEAGLVHSVSNNQQGLHYICNCCTCSCGILRGMADLGIANVVARSAFLNTVDQALCNACGVCMLPCPTSAMSLVRRPQADILPILETISDWKEQRSAARGL